MPTFNVNLDVRNWASNGSDGYTSTSATNGAVYSYQYTGGSDGHGGVEETASAGQATITVSLASDERYRITDIVFSGDIQGQLSRLLGSDGISAVITDTDSSTGDGYYSVVIADNTANCTFACDPPIKNKPN